MIEHCLFVFFFWGGGGWGAAAEQREVGTTVQHQPVCSHHPWCSAHLNGSGSRAEVSRSCGVARDNRVMKSVKLRILWRVLNLTRGSIFGFFFCCFVSFYRVKK